MKGKGFSKNWSQPNQFGEGEGTGFDPKGKGKGWGYQGTCFNCNKVGHTAAECMSTWAPQVSEVGYHINHGNSTSSCRISIRVYQKTMMKMNAMMACDGLW